MDVFFEYQSQEIIWDLPIERHQQWGKRQIDFNGDGLDDVVSSWWVGDSEVHLNHGTDYGPADDRWTLPSVVALEQLEQSSYPWISIDRGYRFVDINGDGQNELIGGGQNLWIGTENYDNQWIEVPNGDPWRIPSGCQTVEGGIGTLGNDRGVRYVDLNGDGLTDLIYSQKSFPVQIFLNQGVVPDLLRTATNPHGGITTFTYGPSTSYDNTGDDDLPDLPMVVQVVTKITFDDRNGSLGFTTFDYQGGLFDGVDREFRGFGQVAATRSVDGRRTVTTYHQDDARSGLPALVTVSDQFGNLWSSVETTYTPDDIAPYVSLPETVSRLEYDGQPNARRSRVEFRYDDLQPSPGGDSPITLGNRTATIEFGEMDSAGTDVDPSDTRTAETSFAPANPATHLADRIAVQRLRAGSEPGEGAMLRASWFYYDGHTSTSAVPTLGELTRRIDLVGVGGEVNPVTTFSYDAYGNLETETSPRENSGELAAGLGTTTHTYDALLSTYVSSVTNGLGHTWQFGYAPLPGACPVSNPPGAGLVHVEKGPNDIGAGTATRRCYDAFGRATLEEGSGALTSSAWVYDDNFLDGDGTKVSASVRVNTAGASRATVSHLDGLGRVFLSDTDGPAGQTVRQVTVFDTAGRIQGQTDPYYSTDTQRITAFGFDTLDRQTLVTQPGARISRAAYDRGKVTLTDPNNLVTVREIDTFGQVRAVIEQGGSTTDKTTYAYSVAGDLIRVADRRGNETAITYDSRGQRRTLNDPDSGLTTYVAYDANGNLKQQTSEAGTLSWTYDALDRVLARSAGAAIDSWTYDTAARGKGLLARQTDASGFYEVEQYDLLGRATHERYTREGKTFPFQNTYTPRSEPATRTYPTGRILEHEYDPKGFLTGIRTQGGNHYASAIHWEADGRPRRWTLGNGDRSEFVYDPVTGRTDHIRLLSPSQSVLDDLDYSFDAGDRVDAIAATVGSFDFDYDALNRLTQATGPYADGFQAKTLQFAYDSLGNLTCHGAADRDSCAATGGTVLTYPNPGVPRPHAPVTVNGEAVGYTATGNLASRGDRTYEYDAYNRLVAARKAGGLLAEFRYDAAGRRIRAIDRSDPRNLTRHLVAADFDWDATHALAHIHVTVGSARIASHADTFTPSAAAVWAPREAPWGVPLALVLVGTPAAAGMLLLLLQLAALRRRGERLSQPALAGTTCILFYLSLVTPSLAQVPDGDLNGDAALDAVDALLSLQIASGKLSPTAEHQAHGDVAPLEAAPDGLLDAADALLVLRAVRGEDVDGDALLTADELAAGASPFRADTDRDGLSDFAEVTIHGTNPAKADTDDDGLSDAEEIQTHQTDPTEADTDGDGLTDGADPEKRSGVAYQHTDHLGSTAIQLGPDGSVVRRLVYRPYGQAVAPTAGGIAKVPNFGFTGQRFEKKLGLYDYGARWYDPVLGRFLQPDPMVPEPSDPQSLNRYSYVRNNPLNRIDPNGHADRAGGVFGFFGVTQPQLDSFQAVLSTGGLFPAAGNILDAVNVVVDVMALDKGSAVADAIAMVDGPGHVVGAVMIGARTGGKFATKAAADAAVNAAGREARGAAKEVVGEAATKEALGGAAKQAPNPNGSRGSPAHQQKITEERQRLEDLGETHVAGDTKAEMTIPTPGGHKESRRMDLTTRRSDGSLHHTQVGRTNKDGVTPVSRERKAIKDVKDATDEAPDFAPFD